jgi:methionyl-tRNA formyltransferase
MTSLVGKKIIVCGYHWIGCKAIDLLNQAGADLYVYTHPAAEAVPCVATFCRERSLPWTFEKIRATNLPFKPDLIASVYYRNLIEKAVIDAVGGKIFNLHPSLLPKYRGCSSLTWAMINDEATAGYTYHYIDTGCDTGDIIWQKRITIEPFDTQQTLYYRVMFRATEDFLSAAAFALSGEPGTPQKGPALYYKRGAPFNGVIDPAWPEPKIERFIRAMTFPPLPYASFCGSPVRTMDEYHEIQKARARKSRVSYKRVSTHKRKSLGSN